MIQLLNLNRVYNHVIINIIVKPRQLDRKKTSRQMFWSDVDKISKYKIKVQRYENQHTDQFENDAELFRRVIGYYIKHHPTPPNKHPVATFPKLETKKTKSS